MKILETTRLLLRTTRLDDIDDLYAEVFSNSEVVKYTFGSENFSFEQAKDFMHENCNSNSAIGLSTLIEKRSEQIIGLAGLIECHYLGVTDYEFGFILGQKFWRKGFATEIGQAQIDYVKDVIKAKRVLALVHHNNAASVKCIDNLGLKYLTSVTLETRSHRDIYYLEF